ncbi:MAG: F0F1 ATP synthase subunit B [Verrucomicrobia bacterium]|nr:F0F1 ATP synthase subunit B [Verrucomicrobiota bacterium]MBV9671618.1 F0F1 ATP synthase subunit B [Verrucomicrobiota bacterium]
MSNLSQVFGVTWAHFLAQVILFIIVYLILKRFAFNPVIAMLEDRRRRIEEGQLNAERIQKQLADAQAKYEQILAQANGEAQKLIESVRQSGDQLADQKRQEALAEAERIVAKAQEAMTLERDRVMAEMKHELGRLVVETTVRVTGKVLTNEDHRRISEEAAREIAA